MPEALKNIFSNALLAGFSESVQVVWPPFDRAAFIQRVFDADWPQRELKQRMRHIAQSLRAGLPTDYAEALDVVARTTQSLIEREGEKLAFEYCFLPDFVEIYGVETPDLSLSALETITRWSSAEFAIRPFLLRYPARLHLQMLAWSKHPSPAVRRLSSEGFRPRLPWGMGVPALKRDPSPILPVLENLRADPAETVRRSVANNLNDISKDHPELVLDIAGRWLGQHPDTDWIVRHACRGLLKKGNAAALAHFGFEQTTEGIALENFAFDPDVRIGGVLHFSFALQNNAPVAQAIRLEYGIDYLTGTGKTSSKVFKIKEINLAPAQREDIGRHQRFQDFTTRKHYPGRHRLCIRVNGQIFAEGDFEVKP